LTAPETGAILWRLVASIYPPAVAQFFTPTGNFLVLIDFICIIAVRLILNNLSAIVLGMESRDL